MSKFEQPVFEHAGYKPPEKDVQAVKSQEQRRVEQGINPEKGRAVKVVDAMMANQPIVDRLFNGDETVRIINLRKEGKASEKSLEKTGIDFFAAYKSGDKKVNCALKAELFEAPPPETLERKKEQEKERLRAEFKVSDEKNYQQTISANEQGAVGPLINIRLSSDNLAEFEKTLEDGEGQFDKNEAGRLELYISFLRRDIQRQLAHMAIKLVGKYTEDYFHEDSNANQENLTKSLYKEKDNEEDMDIDSFLESFNSYMEKLTSVEKERAIDFEVIDKEQNKRDKALINSVTTILNNLPRQ